MAIVTFQSVAAAAEKLVAEGGKASVRAVITELGGGSPNAVLPLLNEWKSGRPLIRASDITLDPRIAGIFAEQLATAMAQAAKAAEDKAADTQSDAEAVAESGREAEAKAAQLEQALEKSRLEVSSSARALEDLALERSRDQQTALETIGNLKVQIDSERERADVAVGKVAEDKVRLEALPKLEAEVQRLAVFEHSAGVLTAKLEDAQALIDDLRQRLAASENATTEARAATEKVSREAEQARIGEQSATTRLESATRELETSKGLLTEAKAEIKEARDELKTLHAQLLDKPKEAKPSKA
jgi:chromosome segregation ATPase